MDEQTFNKLPIAQRKALQQRLKDQNLYGGGIDGQWGSGTAAAFDLEKERKASRAEAERKGRIEERSSEADAALKEAAAKKALAETETAAAEAERKRKLAEEYQRQESSGLGIGTKIAAGPVALMTGKGIGLGLGAGINEYMNEGQRNKNATLQKAAEDRVKGLTTREGAVTGSKLSGAMPMKSPFLRSASRAVPHAGLGALSLATGAELLSDVDEEQPFYPRMADRAFGLANVGMGTGLLTQGIKHAAQPKVSPDTQALSVINSNQLRRKGIGVPEFESQSRGPLKTIDAEVIPEQPESKALPPPAKTETATQSKRQHSDRLISAAKAGGASGIKSKADAASWLEANVTDDNRAAVARELGVKPGPKFMERIGTAVKNMAKSRGASAIVAAATAFGLTPESAEASTGEQVGGTGEALTNAGLAGGAAYGAEKLLSPNVMRMLGAGSQMMMPQVASDMTDEFASPEARNIGARILPSWMRAGAIEDAYQMAQVPEKNPARVYENAFSPGGPDRSIEEALNVVRRANGGRVSGGIEYAGGGRTDNVPMDVEPSSYVVPADVVSALGQGNTMAGVKVLDNMFPPPMEAPGASQPQAKANGGRIPIIAAGGEYVIDPYHVATVGGGDVEQGADILDAFIQDVRQQHISTLSSLPGPAQ